MIELRAASASRACEPAPHRLDARLRGARLLGTPFGVEPGIASEAAAAALAHALGGLRLHRVEALVALENKASQRVIEKLGFTREGVAREAEYVDGRYLDHIQYSFLHGDARVRPEGPC